ncbi:MAG: recombination protein RecR [Acholeplasmatales bacterium]|nr:recombination protein RecR [Acholeplasmatales bacterium]
MKYLDEINALIESLSKYQGVGPKTAERLAINTVTKWNNEEIDNFINALVDIKKLKRCKYCGNITKDDVCEICNSRSNKKIMVIEDVKDLFAIEKCEAYDGVYHILDGVINYQAGITPLDLNLEPLFSRAKEADEIIIATNPSIEGEITAQYIKEMLKDEKCNVTRIAYGLPVGGNLEYADSKTLEKALEGRRNIK